MRRRKSRRVPIATEVAEVVQRASNPKVPRQHLVEAVGEMTRRHLEAERRLLAVKARAKRAEQRIRDLTERLQKARHAKPAGQRKRREVIRMLEQKVTILALKEAMVELKSRAAKRTERIGFVAGGAK